MPRRSIAYPVRSAFHCGQRPSDVYSVACWPTTVTSSARLEADSLTFFHLGERA